MKTRLIALSITAKRTDDKQVVGSYIYGTIRLLKVTPKTASEVWCIGQYRDRTSCLFVSFRIRARVALFLFYT